MADDLTLACLEAARGGGDRPTAAAVDVLLARAAAWSASDLHVSPTADAFVVRLRLDGVLQPAARLPREAVPLLVQRLKVLAGLLTYRTDVPQDGRVDAAATPAGCELRVAVLPTLFGERAVVRLLDGRGAPRDLAGLGWPPDAERALRRALLATQGLIGFCGPAGAGKTTAIYAALREVVAGAGGGGRSCASIEEPVEAAVEGVDQTPVDRAAGLDFAAALRALLRHDPEVVFVGEVRDRETAAVAIEASLTGHLVLTTVHAAATLEALARLLDLGADRPALAAGLRAVFAQRLARRSCAACAGDGRTAGCAACRGTGFRGRLALVEHLAADGPLRAALVAGPDGAALAAAAPGLVPLEARARAAVEAGLTTRDEVARVLGPDAGGPP